MDANHFDHVTKTLPAGTRRGAVRLLTIVPFAGLLASLIGESENALADGSGAGVGGNRGNGPKRRRRNHHAGDNKKNRDRDGDKDGKGSPSCPDCICPPDTRFSAVEACWAKGGAPVKGECECAYIGNGDIGDFPCTGISGCFRGVGIPPGTPVCTMTLDGTGFCADPPFGSEPCNRNDPCDLLTTCVILPDLTCQGHCNPPPAP